MVQLVDNTESRFMGTAPYRTRVRAFLAGLAIATTGASHDALAATTPGADALVGTWTRTWPTSACVVTIEIRADDTMTTVDGANVVEATLQRLGPADVQGMIPVRRMIVHDNEAPACTVRSGTIRVAQNLPNGTMTTIHAEDRPGHIQIGAILLYAHGDAISLCGISNVGSCDHWFSRASPARSLVAVPQPDDFYAIVEHHFYTVIPENRRSFELMPAQSVASQAFPDDGAPSNPPLGCDNFTGLQVVGDGSSGVQFHVASCRNAAAVAARAKALVTHAQHDLLAAAPMTEADRRKFGIGATDEILTDGSEVFYVFELAQGVDAALPFRIAVFVDAARKRGTVLMGIDMSMGERAPSFGADPLGEDPALAMKKVAAGVGRDPVATNWRDR